MNSSDIRAAYEAYPAGFETAFSVTDGRLHCDNNTQTWYNAQIDLIHIYIGFKPPALCLQDSSPSRDVQITIAYTYGYITYRKICSLLSRAYTMDPFVSCIEED